MRIEINTLFHIDMLGILIVLFALSGIQGKAFPSRNKRNYEVSYHYIPYEEGIVRIPAGYSPGKLPNYQDYINGHVQPNRNHWPVYYEPSMLFRSTKNPYSNVNTHHKVKAEHHWHFIDQTPIPITRFSDGIHKLESGVEAQNVIEALHKTESKDGHDADYEVPVVVETLKSEDHVDKEVPVNSFKIKGNPIGYGYDKYPVVAHPSVKHKGLLKNKQKSQSSYEFTKLDSGADNDDIDLPVVVDSLTKKDKDSDSYRVNEPVKSILLISSDESELPVVVDSLSKKEKDDVYYKHEPSRKKPVKTTHFISSDELELPVVDSLTKKEKEDSYFEHEPSKKKPAKSFPFISSDEFELPVVDSLKKVETDAYYKNEPSKKPVKTTHFISSDELGLPIVVDSLTKKKEKADKYYLHGLPKEKPAKNAHLVSFEELELPGIIDSLSKKDNPVKVEPIASYGKYELPDVNSYEKDTVVKPAAPDYAYEPVKEKPIKEKPIKEKPVKEKPVKEKPVKEKPVKEKPIKEKPIKEKPIKEKPIKEKPIKKSVATFDESDYPLESNLRNEVDDYETPIVVEALIGKEEPEVEMEDDYDMPVVVEALVRKHPPGYENEKPKQDKIPNDSYHSRKEAVLTEEGVVSVGGSTVEALSSDEDTSSNKTPEQKRVAFDEADGFEIDEDVENIDDPVVDSLSFEEDIESNETPKTVVSKEDGFIETNEDSFDEGSAMNFDESHFSKSFNPVNSNTFSGVSNKDEGRREFKSCVTLKKETGRCMPFQLCSLSSAANNIDELLRNVCIIDEVFLGVCCPAFPVETVRVDWEQLKPDTDEIHENSSENSKECGKLPRNVTDKDAWPWMALLIARSSDKIFCGGALISEQYVLTAAHCTKRIPRNRILVRLGNSVSENSPKQDFEVIEIKRHSLYNPRTMQNDIALLKLSRRVRFGNFRRAVCLAKADEGIESLVSESASLLRWKGTPGEIKDVESLSVISRRECQNGMRTTIADSIICTEPRTDETMCNADSGAPLVIEKDDKFEVIGILTWNRNDCDERFPTVFTRVSSYHQWIENLAI